MKIAMLLDAQVRPQVLDNETIERFSKLGEVVFNETKENDIENASKRAPHRYHYRRK